MLFKKVSDTCIWKFTCDGPCQRTHYAGVSTDKCTVRVKKLTALSACRPAAASYHSIASHCHVADAHLIPITTIRRLCSPIGQDVRCVVDYTVCSVAQETHSVITITTIPESDIIHFTVQIYRTHIFLALNLGLKYEIQVPNIGVQIHYCGFMTHFPPIAPPMPATPCHSTASCE